MTKSLDMIELHLAIINAKHSRAPNGAVELGAVELGAVELKAENRLRPRIVYKLTKAHADILRNKTESNHGFLDESFRQRLPSAC